MKILGLDLATSTGYAYNDDRGQFHCGSWLLATDAELKAARKQRLNRRLDPRVTKLFQLTQGLQSLHNFDVIVFEDVEFSSYTLQCQLWASFRAAIWLAPQTRKQPIFEAVPVQTLKKFATGHGGATKEMMCRALVKQDPCFSHHPASAEKLFYRTLCGVNWTINDDAVDAVWLWKWAKQFLGRIKV